MHTIYRRSVSAYCMHIENVFCLYTCPSKHLKLNNTVLSLDQCVTHPLRLMAISGSSSHCRRHEHPVTGHYAEKCKTVAILSTLLLNGHCFCKPSC